MLIVLDLFHFSVILYTEKGRWIMADKARFPQIPSTVWWGMRAVLQRTPNATIDERYLSVQLDVQEAAARAYLTELRSVGLLTEEGKATPLAQEWRLDETYAQAVEKLISKNYPEGLIHVAPPGDGDRQKIVNWFLKEGFGQGAAGNKAATYMLMGSRTPNESPSRSSRPTKSDDGGQPSTGRRSNNKNPSRQTEVKLRPADKQTTDRRGQENMQNGVKESIPLNINVQIHISAEAGADQIESIFSAMRRYLYDTEGT